MWLIRNYGFSIWITLLSLGQSWAQVCPPKPSANSALGSFNIDLGNRLCVGQTIKVSDQSGGTNIQYWFEYAGASAPVTGGSIQTQWTYQQAGKFVVIQQGSLNGTGSYTCQIVEVLATPPPVFTVKSCQNRQVGLSIPVATANGYDEYTIDWGDGSTPQTVAKTPTNTIHTYPDIIPRTIKVSGRYVPANCGAFAEQSITPSGLPAPVFDKIKLEVITPDRVEISFKGIPDHDIEILKSTGFNQPFLTTGLINNASGDVKQGISNVDVRANVQCFKLMARDACGVTTDFPEPVCSVPFQVVAQINQNDVQWTPYQSATFTSYNLLRDGASLTTSNQKSLQQYSDKNAKCARFCYRLQIQTQYVESLNEQVCVGIAAATKPPAPTGLLGTITQNQVVLKWNAVTNIPQPRYRIFRGDGATASFQWLKDTLSTTHVDATIDPSTRPYCYQLTYRDGCGNESEPSSPVCVIFLAQQSDELVWTAYQRFLSGNPVYIVEQLDANGSVITTFPAGTSLNYTPSVNPGEKVRFRIRARAIDGQESYSNEVVFGETIQLFVPNAFSPNGDAINDTFEPKGQFQTFKMLIYSRWGDVVYETEDRNKGWDGQYNGVPVQEGAYVYRIEVTGADGKTHVRTGTMTLVR